MSSPEIIHRPCIFGEVLFDRFPDGSQVLGGAPFNIAWHLQAFDREPVFISRVGDDPQGEEIIHSMQQWGMDTCGLQTDPVHPTGVVDIRLNNGEPEFDIITNCAYDHILASELPELHAGLIYHGSLAIREEVSRNALMTLKKSTQAPVFIDVNLRQQWWQKEDVLKCLSMARWAKLNNHELATLAVIDGDLHAQAEDIRKRFDLEILIITLGKDGAFAIGPDGTTPQVRPTGSEVVIDTVGAGDGFASICILGLMKNWELLTMLERAQSFASSIVSVRGATIGDDEFYQGFINQWKLPDQ